TLQPLNSQLLAALATPHSSHFQARFGHTQSRLGTRVASDPGAGAELLSGASGTASWFLGHDLVVLPPRPASHTCAQSSGRPSLLAAKHPNSCGEVFGASRLCSCFRFHELFFHSGNRDRTWSSTYEPAFRGS